MDERMRTSVPVSASGEALGEAARTLAQESARDAAARFAARAEANDLADVVYTSVDSPLGPIALAATERGLVRVAYLTPGVSVDDVAGELAARVSPRVLAAPRRLDPVRRELDEYFAGRRRRFDVALDWRLVHGFGLKVLAETARIGYGATASYAELAQRAGNGRAYRAAGNALNRNPLPIIVPCHRVLQSGGGLGGYACGLDAKRFLLRLEGALGA